MKVYLLILAALAACVAASDEKKIVCYFGSWAVYRPGNGLININDINPTLCTHLIYTFVGLEPSSGIKILDPWADLPDGGGKDGFKKFNQLRGLSPRTKTLIAIGGWNEGSAKYSEMAATEETRKAFAENAVRFVRLYGFDGLDFDWEYPNQRGGEARDKENYILLLNELKKRFDEAGLLLTAAVAAVEKSAKLSYDITEVVKHLSFVNVMAYDLHGVWDNKTGINAPLYAGSWEKKDDLMLNVNASIHYWLSEGAPAEKIVLGMPLYGRTFTLDDPKNKAIGAPAHRPGKKGPYTREESNLGYNEICEMQMKEKWEVHYQEEQRVPYAVKGDQWVGYENVRSIQEKAELVNKLGLGGAMVWSIETDDFRGICGTKYPMLKTLNHVLRGAPPLPEPSAPTTSRPQFKCTQAGYGRDFYDCSVFYICVPTSGGEFQQNELKCSAGLVFDLEKKSCNWPAEVDCSDIAQ